MNYEDTKILMTKEMEDRTYGRDTRKKCLITLNQICQHSEKYHDTNLLDSSDARSFFHILHNVKKINPSEGGRFPLIYIQIRKNPLYPSKVYRLLRKCATPLNKKSLGT